MNWDVTARGIFLALVLLLNSNVSTAAEPARTALGGNNLLPGNAVHALMLGGRQMELGALDRTSSDAAPIIRLSTRTGVTHEWYLQATLDSVLDLKKDEVALIRFRIRCTESMTGEGSIGVIYEQSGGDHLKAVVQTVGAPREWKTIEIPFKADRDYLAGQSRLCLRIGFDRQTVELSGLEAINFGTRIKLEDLPRTRFSYVGREADAPWRAAANERIEKIRKGDLAINVLGANGQPIPGATVEARLERHAFLFGVAINPNVLLAPSQDGERYRNYIEQHFNSAVFENDMKWTATWHGISPKTDQALQWLRDRNFRVRGHTVVWPSWRWSPKELRALENDPAALRTRVEEHIDTIMTHFKGKLPQWDVVNEPYTERDLIKLLGGDEVLIDWFQRAHAADPASQLFLNDFGIFDMGRHANPHADHFYRTIRFLKDRGAPIGGIGIQSHFASELPSPEGMLKTLDRFSELGLPIESTEVSFDTDDRPLQADYMRDYMTALFSHPKVTGITHWGFWSKAHWRPRAAMVADDWTVLPHGEVFSELMRKTWSTHTTLQTDANGNCTLRGFRGHYRLMVKTPDGRSKTSTAEINGERSHVTIRVD